MRVAGVVSDATFRPDDMQETVGFPKILHPYFGWTLWPRARSLQRLSNERQAKMGVVGAEWLQLRNNNWGFHSPHDFPYKRNEGDYIIMVLGGSVAKWFCLQAGEAFCEALRDSYPDLEKKNLVFASANPTIS